MFGFFKKQKWVLVKIVTEEVEILKTKERGTIYFNLFESDKGNRRLDITSTLPFSTDRLYQNAEKLEIYNTTVYRWLKGRHDPEILRYNQIGEEDLANALKGKI